MFPPLLPHLVTAGMLALVMLVLTTAFHHYALEFLARRSGGRLSRAGVVRLVVALVGVHVVHITVYALVFAVAAGPAGLGRLQGVTGDPALGYFFFAAETYSTLGYGDIVPVGSLRLIASVESLNGLLLLAWSGAFLYGVLEGGRAGPRRNDE